MARVLIVDDERGIRITFKEFLEDEGHVVSAAGSAEEAVQLLDQQPIDVVVADVILPRMTGMDLVRAVRERSEEIEIILISGEPTVSTAIEAMRGRVYDYLSKPVSGEHMCQVVAHAAKVKTLRDENKRLSEENLRYQQRLEQMIRERTVSLKERESLLHGLLDSLPHEFWAMDLDLKVFLQNSDSRRNWGDAIGKSIDEIDSLDEEQRLLLLDFLTKGLSGETIAQDVKSKGRVVHIMVAPLKTNGHIRGVLGRRVDVTDRVRNFTM